MRTARMKMEAFKSTIASPLTATTRRTHGDGGVNFFSRRQRLLLRNAKQWCSCCIEVKKYWIAVACPRGIVQLPQVGDGSRSSLLLQQRLRSESRTKCRSNDKSSASSVLVVDGEEVENHGTEILDPYVIEDDLEGDDGDKDKDDDNNPDGRGEIFFRRRVAPGARLYTLIRWKEDLMENLPEEKHWWMNLDIRRMLTPRTRGILLLNILTFLYGSNISIIKNAGTTMDPTLFSVGRFAIASIAFAPYLSPSLTKKGVRKASIELGLLASAGYLTQCVSVLTSDAARVSFISTFTVIVVPLFAGLSGAKISKITWFSAAAALVGVGLLESNGASFAIGDIWSFVSAVVFGVHILRTEHHSKTLSSDDSLPVMALQLVVITICSGLWSCASHFQSGDLLLYHATNWQHVWEGTVALPWLPMLYTGLLSTAFCLWTELVSMRDVKATEAAVIYTTEPLWGAAFAWVTLGERWGANGWLGAFFILGGSLTMQLFGRPDTSAPKKVDIPSSSQGIGKVDSCGEEEFEVKPSKTIEREHEKHTAPAQIQASKVRSRSRTDNH